MSSEYVFIMTGVLSLMFIDPHNSLISIQIMNYTTTQFLFLILNWKYFGRL